MAEPNSTETALALHIQEGRATEPAIATALVKQFSPGVQRFTLLLLNDPDAPEIARTLTRQTFAVALNDPDSFAGKDNIRVWLYTQAMHQTRALPVSQRAHPLSNTHYQLPITNYQLASLPQQESLPLLLRYGHRLALHDIAQLLRTSENKIHKHLTRARQKLILHFSPHPTDDSANHQISKSVNQQLIITNYQLPITHHPRQIQLLLDGLLDSRAETTFRSHLDTCPACQTHLKQYAELEFHLNTLLSHEPPLPQEEIEEIVWAVTEKEISPSTRTWNLSALLKQRMFSSTLPFREILWVVTAATLFLLLARWLNPFFSSSPSSSFDLTPTLPPAQNLTTVFRQNNPPAPDGGVPTVLISPDVPIRPFPDQHVIWTLSEIRTGTHIPTTPMVFSPFGYAAAFGTENRVVLWDLMNARGQVEFEGHESIVTALEFSPDEEFLATGDEDGNVFIWNSFDGLIHFRLGGHPGAIRSLAYSQNGQYVAVGLNSGVWLWEISETAAVRVQQIHWEWIRVLAFSPDGKWLAAADRNETIAIWSIPDGRVLLRYQTLPSPDGERLDVITRQAFSPDGKKLATGSFNGMVEIVALNTTSEGKVQGTRLYTLPHPAWISEVRWSPDGRLLATISDTGLHREARMGIFADTASRAVYLWDVESGTLAHAPLTARIARGLSRAIFNPLGNELLVSNFDGSVFQWKLEDVSHLVAAMPEPQLFTRMENNVREGTASPETQAISFTDPQQIQAGFEIIEIIPGLAQYTFVGGTFFPEESLVRLNYQSTSGKIVTLTQRPATPMVWVDPHTPSDTLTSPSSSDWIGASAVIQPVQFHGTIGEYVVGSWTLTSPDNPTALERVPVYRWHAAGEARLRWVQDGYLLELQAPLFQLDRDNFSLNDLVRLAEILAAPSEQPILLAYKVENGDTCIGIAERYGTTTDLIARTNGRDNCDLILAGETLLVPLPAGRETVAEVDLNCDGSLERIRAIPDLNRSDLTTNFGFVVEAIPLGGDQFWPVWQLTVADVSVDFFGVAYTIHTPGCEQWLVVEAYSDTWEFSGEDLYRWDGQQMHQVLDANGWLAEIVYPGEGGATAFTITTQYLTYDQFQGTCVRTITRYEWDGSIFVEVEQTREGGVDCFEG